MKILMGFLVVFGSLTTAFAKDSSWLLCSGDVHLFGGPANLAINVYAYRNGAERATDLTLIFGSHVMIGSSNSAESDSFPVVLSGMSSWFIGQATVDYSLQEIRLAGDLSLSEGVIGDSENTAVNAILRCGSLSDK